MQNRVWNTLFKCCARQLRCSLYSSSRCLWMSWYAWDPEHSSPTLSLSCSASPPCSLSVPTVTLRALPPFPRVMSSARGTPLYLSTLSVQWIPGTVSAFLSVCVGIRELAYCAHRWHKSAEIGSFQLLRRPCDGLLSHFTKLSFKMSWIKFEKAKCINYPYTTKKHMKSNAKS